MLFAAFSLLLFMSCQAIEATDLCKSSDWWYDIQSAKCKPCKTCDGKSFVMEPCSEFKDTWCVDLLEISRSINRNIEKGEALKKWRETEEFDPETTDVPPIPLEKSKSMFEDFARGHMVMIAFGLAAFFVVISITVLISGCSLKFVLDKCRSENRTVTRARLFSRDRLNTTEYMKNLATLDRRLAMDEILEKRKKAIFEPHLLQENVYTDEVFVDISGLPKNFPDDHEYDELDHRRCLLRMQEQH